MDDQDKKEFVINKYLTLKLKGKKTKIYAGGHEFLICKAVIVNIPKEKIPEVKSMDDVFEVSEVIEEEKDFTKYGITPLTEFWVHCSNLQVWAENGYNTDLLQTDLAFPLLKRLSELGDVTAKIIFKEEIARRYAYGTYDTKDYLEYEGFLDYLTMEELIIGGLPFEESSLVLDIIDFMKQYGITYEIAKSLDEDKVRHRLNSSEHFFTLEYGHVYIFEYDLFNESIHLLSRFSAFKGMRNLILYLRDLKQGIINNLNLKNVSIKALEIYAHSVTEYTLKILTCFPNLKYLSIYSPLRNKINKIDLIISLKKLKIISFNDCLSEETFKELLILKDKGVKIINNQKKKKLI